MIFHVINIKDTNKNKMDMQKSVAFLYVNIKLLKTIKKIKISHLVMSLTREGKKLYTKPYKTLIK
jgi:hypothetical protein